MARQRGAQLIVIDVWRTRTARRADWFIPLRVGTDAALALGLAHVLQREGLLDRQYIERLVLGYDRWAREVLPRYPPHVVESITGVSAGDVVKLALAYGRARAPFIRLGQGLSRNLGGGQRHGPLPVSQASPVPGSTLEVGRCWPLQIAIILILLPYGGRICSLGRVAP
jgi:anaerobic selenocysteine-containing dehydrogenase